MGELPICKVTLAIRTLQARKRSHRRPDQRYVGSKVLVNFTAMHLREKDASMTIRKAGSTPMSEYNITSRVIRARKMAAGIVPRVV